MMLDHLGLNNESARIRQAIISTLRSGTVKTPDLGGSSGTVAFTEALITAL